MSDFPLLFNSPPQFSTLQTVVLSLRAAIFIVTGVKGVRKIWALVGECNYRI